LAAAARVLNRLPNLGIVARLVAAPGAVPHVDEHDLVVGSDDGGRDAPCSGAFRRDLADSTRDQGATPGYAGAMAAVLVTGASRTAGIAAAVARALAADGWTLALTGFPPHDAREGWTSEPERLVAELGAAWHEDDLADPAAPPRILDAAESAVGPLTALVNVHAHSETGGLLEATREQLDRHWAVNARGPALLSAEFARRFRSTPRDGRIVNFTSGLPLAGELAYAASKGALEWITVSTAAELAGHGISVNAVDPGPTDTGWLSPELRARIEAEMPLGRLGRPEDSAALVAFLCSPAGGWITGQVLRCDGGWSSARIVRVGREPA
jgi:3-oxoacyl-[acyl-carrier protein] reductase